MSTLGLSDTLTIDTLEAGDVTTHVDGVRGYLRDTWLLVERSLQTLRRVPMRLSDVTIQPVMFTFLFLYVFGSAIDIPGIRYQDYLLPGLIGQSIAFGVIGAGVATANDFGSGVVERFRSMPVSRLAIISAQVAGQVLEQVLGIVIVAGVGLALGWRPHMSAVETLALVLLIVFGLLAFTWLGVVLGMLLRSPDAVQGIGFAIVFPLAFLAGTFVPIEGMALVPRTIAEWNPMSAIVASVRQLTQGQHASGSWLLEHPILSMVVWCTLIIGVCAPLALRRFREPTPPR